MSCGNHHDMKCRDVLDRVYEYLDGELDAPEYAKIQQHLIECGPCLRQFDLADALKTLVRRSCCEAAPDELRLKILARITEVRVSYEV